MSEPLNVLLKQELYATGLTESQVAKFLEKATIQETVLVRNIVSSKYASSVNHLVLHISGEQLNEGVKDWIKKGAVAASLAGAAMAGGAQAHEITTTQKLNSPTAVNQQVKQVQQTKTTFSGERNEKGVPDGPGTLTLPDGTKYSGNFYGSVGGTLNGIGTITFKDGSTWKGPFEKNKPNGNGTYTSGQHSMQLYFNDGKPHDPNFKENVKYGGEGEFTVDNGVMTFSGAITIDSPWEMQEILKKNPDIHTVVIDSKGGITRAGMTMGNIIKQHNLKVVAKTAWSAAGLMAVGDPNFKGAAALHSPHLNGKTVAGGSTAISIDRNLMNDYLIKMGMSQDAIDDTIESSENRWVKITSADIKK